MQVMRRVCARRVLRGGSLMKHSNRSARRAPSSAEIAADLFRLIPRNERAAFREMLEHELPQRDLRDNKLTISIFSGRQLQFVIRRSQRHHASVTWPCERP
jgi:hypothetical protein